MNTLLKTFFPHSNIKAVRSISLSPININKDFKNLLRESKTGSIDLEKGTNGIAYILINNPSKKNAITGQMMLHLNEIVSDLEGWSEGRAVVVRGAEGTFCSGGDRSTIDALMEFPEEGALMSRLMQNLLIRLWNLPLISVACIEGKALGGGAEFSIATDYRVMAHDAVIGFVQAKVGLSCGWGGSVRLPNLIGRRKALYLLASSKLLSCPDALNLGVADKGTDKGEDAFKSTMDFLEPMLSAGPDIVHAMKRSVVNASFDWGSVHDTLARETDLFQKVFASNILNTKQKFK